MRLSTRLVEPAEDFLVSGTWITDLGEDVGSVSTREARVMTVDKERRFVNMMINPPREYV